MVRVSYLFDKRSWRFVILNRGTTNRYTRFTLSSRLYSSKFVDVYWIDLSQLKVEELLISVHWRISNVLHLNGLPLKTNLDIVHLRFILRTRVVLRKLLIVMLPKRLFEILRSCSLNWLSVTKSPCTLSRNKEDILAKAHLAISTFTLVKLSGSRIKGQINRKVNCDKVLNFMQVRS